ncbi:uncharacterized protein LOC110099080 [Dendrobium catenatum]|uniref:uncharacterized protein LOC110099080 n=1 Tax=Dendrobium catenatum TaxID=906689 RepID=UPI0009F1F831|nr:uncharacterized protein LOC110099080 [Dendrobium catenatum]
MAEACANCDLHDLGFSGPNFTWSNNEGTSRIWVRIDRILINCEGLNAAPFASVKQLNRLSSDHCPLILSLGSDGVRPSSKWLRFEDVWLSYPVSWKIVVKAWGRTDFGCPVEVLVDCSDDGLTPEQDVELRNAVGEFNLTLARLTTWWRQWAKVRWIEEGDANSHFFHTVATARRRSNRIEELQTRDGETTRDPKVIHDEFWHFFRTSEKPEKPTLIVGQHSRLRI